VTDSAQETRPEEARSSLDKALDRGELETLPPNIPPGFMGEVAPDMRTVDDFESDGVNAGLIQESTWETKWLWVVLLYVMVITAPIAFWMLWREPGRTYRAKVIATGLMVAGYVALLVYALS
jgi:hypothetical protein